MIARLVNGVSTDLVSVMDRAIHYGDGVFETVAIRDGRPELWLPHIKRLQQGCERLGFSAPDAGLLTRETAQLSRPQKRAVLKIVISRGSDGRGYRPPEKVSPTRILSLHPWPEWPDAYGAQGIHARICNTRLGRNPQLAGIKHLNRLEQVLARDEWHDPDIAEGLMLDVEGLLVEGTMSNLFLVRNGVLLTPDLSQCGVAGIMRGIVMEVAQQLGIRCETGHFTLLDLIAAEEVFVTNSIIRIWAVNRIDANDYSVPGEITHLIQSNIDAIGTELLI